MVKHEEVEVAQADQLMTDEDKAAQVEQRIRQVEQQLFSNELEQLDPGRVGYEEADKAERERLQAFIGKLKDRLRQLRGEAAK